MLFQQHNFENENDNNTSSMIRKDTSPPSVVGSGNNVLYKDDGGNLTFSKNT